jgi:hypothetical protein
LLNWFVDIGYWFEQPLILEPSLCKMLSTPLPLNCHRGIISFVTVKVVGGVWNLMMNTKASYFGRVRTAATTNTTITIRGVNG